MTAATTTLGGHTVITGRVCLPRVGTWTASLALDTEETVTGSLDLVLGEGALTLAGTVMRGGWVDGRVEVLVVGGRGLLATVLPPLAYRGVPVRAIAGDLLTAAGESLSTTSDAAVTGAFLDRWTRVRGPASSSLSTLAETLGAVWRVVPDGSVWLGVDVGYVSLAEGEVLQRYPAEGGALVAFSKPTLLPGQVFDDRIVSYIEHQLEPNASRSIVWFEP